MLKQSGVHLSSGISVEHKDANLRTVRTNRGPIPDDVLLGDLNLDSPLSPSFPR